MSYPEARSVVVLLSLVKRMLAMFFLIAQFSWLACFAIG
jgi:hypothetical protein